MPVVLPAILFMILLKRRDKETKGEVLHSPLQCVIAQKYFRKIFFMPEGKFMAFLDINF